MSTLKLVVAADDDMMQNSNLNPHYCDNLETVVELVDDATPDMMGMVVGS